MVKFAACLALLALATPAAAQEAFPRHLPAAGGHVVIPDAAAASIYDEYHFAPARRAGDWLYISGVIAGRRPGEGNDVAAFKAQVRRAFQRIDSMLKAEGLTFADVTLVNTFHVWEGPNFAGSKAEQFQAFSAVKDEFMPPPHPAWTAVGTTGLLTDGGIVEIQAIAHAPNRAARR